MLLKNNVDRRIPTIVFCNRSPTVCFLGYFLGDNNIHHIYLHGNMPEKVRTLMLSILGLILLLFFN